MTTSSGRASVEHQFETADGSSLHVVAYRGQEQLGAPYEFQVYFLAENSANLELDALIGQRSTLTSVADEHEPLRFHGVIASAELLEVFRHQSLYQAELVPEVWRASIGRNTRVFVDVSVHDILSEILSGLGLSGDQFSLSFAASAHKVYPQICQYNESDLSFISRWMEREGLHYYFEQGASAERLVVVDGRPHEQQLNPGTVRFRNAAGLDSWGVSRIRARSKLLTSSVSVVGYDASRPAVAATAQRRIAGSVTGLATKTLLSTEIADPAVAREADVLEQIETAQRLVFAGEANAPTFRPGYQFELQDHPLPQLERKFYVTQVTHKAGQPSDDVPEAVSVLEAMGVHDSAELLLGYATQFLAVYADVTYRLPRSTPLPRIYGTLSGTVDGVTESDYAQLDDVGRYRVRLRFDDAGGAPGAASMWVRMLQPHAGNPEGFHSPLRKGTEVMLVFLGGDPDQPMIAGAVPNALTPSPVVRANQTTNILHTAGDNHFELEDQRGSQHIELKTPTETTMLRMGAPFSSGGKDYNLIETTSGDGRLYTGRRYDVQVDGSHEEEVVGSVTQRYKDARTTTVTANVTELFQSDQTTNVLGDVRWDVAGEYAGHVHDDYTLTVDGDYSVDYEADTVETFHGATSSSYMGALNQNFLGVVNSNSLSAVNTNYASLVNTNYAALSNTNYVGGFVNTSLAVGMNIAVGGTINVDVASRMNVTTSGSLTFEAALAASIFVGGTLDIRLAVDISVALVQLSLTALSASETIISLSNNVIEASGCCIDLTKSDTQVNNTSAAVTP